MEPTEQSTATAKLPDLSWMIPAPSPERLKVIIRCAGEIWEEPTGYKVEIGSKDEACCGSNVGDIENMFVRAESGTWIRAWVWVADVEVDALEARRSEAMQSSADSAASESSST